LKTELKHPRRNLEWTTEDEKNYITGLSGWGLVPKSTARRKMLLRNYLKSPRINWGLVNSLICMEHAKTMLYKL